MSSILAAARHMATRWCWLVVFPALAVCSANDPVGTASVVTTVAVAPASASIEVGATVPLQATVNDQNGNVMSGQIVTWSTDDAAAATVNSSGLVTGVAAGS